MNTRNKSIASLPDIIGMVAGEGDEVKEAQATSPGSLGLLLRELDKHDSAVREFSRAVRQQRGSLLLSDYGADGQHAKTIKGKPRPVAAAAARAATRKDLDELLLSIKEVTGLIEGYRSELRTKDIKVKEEYPPSYVPAGVVSFRALDTWRAAMDVSASVNADSEAFVSLVANIVDDATITDKPAAVIALTSELASRLDKSGPIKARPKAKPWR